MLAALAASTETIRLGTMVSPVTFRLPAVLAKAAVTVDRISGGRVEIGMGAGWWEEEHRTHGFPFPDAPTRFDMLEEQLEIVHGLLTEERFSFHGKHYQLDDGTFRAEGRADAASADRRRRQRRSAGRRTRLALGRRVQHRRVHRRSRLVSGSAGCGTDSTPTVARKRRSRRR